MGKTRNMLTKNDILINLKSKKELLARYGVKKIGLFGSYAKNRQHEGSDIDLIVDFYQDQETFDNLMKVYDILEKSFSGHKIEIVTKNGLSKYIGSYILNETEYA